MQFEGGERSFINTLLTEYTVGHKELRHHFTEDVAADHRKVVCKMQMNLRFDMYQATKLGFIRNLNSLTVKYDDYYNKYSRRRGRNVCV